MKNKEIYVHGLVKDYKCNLEKYLFGEVENLNAIIDDLEEKIDNAIKEINYMITNADITEIRAIKLIQILGGDSICHVEEEEKVEEEDK